MDHLLRTLPEPGGSHGERTAHRDDRIAQASQARRLARRPFGGAAGDSHEHRVREVCPVFPDDPERIHWSFPDPARVVGSEETRSHAFEQTSLQLATRIRLLITLLEREHRR